MSNLLNKVNLPLKANFTAFVDGTQVGNVAKDVAIAWKANGRGGFMTRPFETIMFGKAPINASSLRIVITGAEGNVIATLTDNRNIRKGQVIQVAGVNS